MIDDRELDAWLLATAALLGLHVAPEWHDSVRTQLRITRDLAEQVLQFPLPDESDPAPVFRA